MKCKRLLRFYFRVDGMESALQKLIVANACRSAESCGSGEFYADKILSLIEAKGKLAELWNYLYGVISALSDKERAVLERYADMRCGIRRLSAEEQRAIKRAVVKFVRHARILDRYKVGVQLVNEYYCLM